MKFENNKPKKIKMSLYLEKQNIINETKIIHQERFFMNKEQLKEEAHKALDEAIEKLYNKK